MALRGGRVSGRGGDLCECGDAWRGGRRRPVEQAGGITLGERGGGTEPRGAPAVEEEESVMLGADVDSY